MRFDYFFLRYYSFPIFLDNSFSVDILLFITQSLYLTYFF